MPIFYGFFLLLSYKSCIFASEITAKDVMKKLNYHITMNVVSGYLSDTQQITPPVYIVSI